MKNIRNIVGALALSCSFTATAAHAAIAFEFDVPTITTGAAGSTIPLYARVLNTGDQNIVFGPKVHFTDMQHADAIGVIFYCATGNCFNNSQDFDVAKSFTFGTAGDVFSAASLFSQFENKTIAPGNYLEFVLGTTKLPLIPVGSISMNRVDFGLSLQYQGQTNDLQSYVYSTDFYRVEVGQEFSKSFGTIGGAVPEPSTWAMMLVGFCIVGWSIRRRHLRLPPDWLAPMPKRHAKN